MVEQLTEGYTHLANLHYAVAGLNTVGISWLVTMSLVTMIGGCYYLYNFITKLNSHHDSLTKDVRNISRALDKLSTDLRSQQTEILDRQSKGILRMDRLEQEINKIKRKR